MAPVTTLATPPFERTGHIQKHDGPQQTVGARRWFVASDVAAHFARTAPSVVPVASEVATQCVNPAEAQPGQQRRRDSPQSARNADAVPSRTPEAIGEAAAEEVHRLEEAVGALGEESPRSKPLLDAFKVAKAKVNVPISVQIDSTPKYLERARKSRSAKGSMCCRCGSSQTELRAVELVLLQSRIDDLIRERDSPRVSADQGHVEVAALSNAEEVNMLRANVDSLECERAMFRAEVGRCRGNADPSALMSTLNDRGDTPARESGLNRFNRSRQ